MVRVAGRVRGVFTLIGAGAVGLEIWISTQIGQGTLGGYWAVYGILAGAGLTMALSQLFGGWTKWGWPRISASVFVVAFLPALLCAGWVLLAGQPDANWFQRHTTSWSGHLAIDGLVADLRQYLGVLAFGLGLVFGFTFDTSGPRLRHHAPEPSEETAADETAIDAGAGQPIDVPEREEQPVS